MLFDGGIALKRALFVVFCVLVLCSLTIVGISKAGNPDYSLIEYQCAAPQTIDGKWTTPNEWFDGPPITMSNNARFTYNIDFNDNYRVCWLIEFFTDNTADAGDYWQICMDSNNGGGTAPQADDWMIAILGHSTLKVYHGNGAGWTEITPDAGEITWSNTISSTPWNSTPHWILEFSDSSKIDGSIKADAPPNGLRVAAYDANTGTLAAWAPDSNMNVPDEWGVISGYSMDPYPGPTLTLNLSPSTVARGSPLTISGQLTPAPGAPATIYLYYRYPHNTGTWRLATTLKTNAAGAYIAVATVPLNLPPGQYDLVAVWFNPTPPPKYALSTINLLTIT